MIRFSRFTPLFITTLLAGFAVSCGRPSGPIEITEKRELSSFEPSVKAGLSTKTRFGLDEKPRENPFTWTAPAGWTQVEATRDRIINFKFGPNQEGECYLSVIQGAAGGLLPNLNRWRNQMGQPPIDELAIEKLPRRIFLGLEAVLLEVDGDFKGMGTEAKKDFRLTGLILPTKELTFFVKMTGPRALVSEQQNSFDQFIQSIQLRRSEQ